MLYLIYIIVGIVSLWAIGKLFRPNKRLLQIEVSTDDGCNYLVNSENINQECKPIEWVWLNLHLPARFIFNIGNQSELQSDKKHLMELMSRFSKNNWNSSKDVVDIANKYLSEKMTMDIGFGEGKKIIGTLSYTNIASRSLNLKLKFFSQFHYQFTHTFVCSIAMAADIISFEERKHLKRSLGFQYSQLLSMDTSSFETLKLPSLAFAEGSALAIFQR